MTKCDRCKYEWQTKSKMYYVTCPKCHKTVKIVEFKEVVKKVEHPGTLGETSL